MDQEQMAQLTALVKKAMGPNWTFSPYAVHHSELDMLIVGIRECSHAENHLSPFFSIYEENYPQPGIANQYCGFHIEPALALSRYRSLLDSENKVDILELLDAVLIRDVRLRPYIEIAREMVLQNLKDHKVKLQ